MLTSKQRARLASLAAGLDPIVHLGKAGAADGVAKALDEALEHHEMVKLRFVDFKGSRRELADDLAARSRAELVRVIGNVAVLYRRNPDPDKRVVELE